MFALESVWRSDALPRPGVVVDVEFDERGRVAAMRAVPEARLAREQAEAAIACARAYARARGAELGAGLAGRFGPAKGAALGLLLLGWFGLATFRLEALLADVTFWQVLGLLNAGLPLDALRIGPAPGAGPLGLCALLCLGGPLLPLLSDDRRASLAALLPLACMLAVASALPALLGAASWRAAAPGAGAWLSLLAGIYFAQTGLRDFLVARARDCAVFYENP